MAAITGQIRCRDASHQGKSYMAENPRNKGKLTRKNARFVSEPDTAFRHGIIIDLNSYAPRHERTKSRNHRKSLIEARTRAQGQYMPAI